MTNGAEKLKTGSVMISGDLYAFLMGEGPLDGTWFDEMKLPGKFWWRALLRAAERDTRTPAPSSEEEWSLSFHGSPPSSFVKADKPGLPDSRRDLAYFEYENLGQRNAHGKQLQKVVAEHNDTLLAIQGERDAAVEGFALADRLVCAAIEGGFYVGEGLLAELASARAALTATG
jgi:hypothetical protein